MLVPFEGLLVGSGMLQAVGQRSNCKDPSLQSIEGLCFLSQSCPRKISLVPQFVTPRSIRSLCAPMQICIMTKPEIDPAWFRDPSAL
jgi:hypothetical protein